MSKLNVELERAIQAVHFGGAEEANASLLWIAMVVERSCGYDDIGNTSMYQNAIPPLMHISLSGQELEILGNLIVKAVNRMEILPTIIWLVGKFPRVLARQYVDVILHSVSVTLQEDSRYQLLVTIDNIGMAKEEIVTDRTIYKFVIESIESLDSRSRDLAICLLPINGQR